jgi:hypothetical protein
MLCSHLQPKTVTIKLYNTIISPGALYRCETWSLTLRKEHTYKLRVFEKRVLKRVLGPRKGEEVVGWRKLHSDIKGKCKFVPELN